MLVAHYKISCWTHRDLDHILNEGDNLFKSQNTDLSEISWYIFNLKMTEETLHEGGSIFRGTFFEKYICIIS